MRICYLANAESAHTIKFCDFFSSLGHEIFVVSFNKAPIVSATVVDLDDGYGVHSPSEANKLKSVLQNVTRVRGLLKGLVPDILHAHYATSYGLLAALVGVRPFILSLWGSDVYEFPHRSLVHSLALRYIIGRANVVLSTSQAMKQEARRYSAKEIEVVPFGVDLSVFFPAPHEHMQKDAFTIGVAKMLEPVYGLDDLVDAFALVHRRNPGAFVRLQIGGTGEQERELRQRTERLEVQNVVDFLGWLDPAGVAALYRRCDLAVFPSRRESFCVSAVEAQACGVPVVATNVGGLPEATLPGKSSLIVQPRDVGALAMAIERLLKDPSLRSRMGVEGRRFVVEHYDIRENFGRLARIYDEVGSVRTRTGF